ncbi:MAG TPA: nucleotidyltransferase domain-containing protein [Candidatus Thermoplasmatota archaeon]|nr:nucleotidyltransferase domain-containing protein [Candidatus Thermoplasmatota archaeon]
MPLSCAELDFPYTARDTPALRARIDRDLEAAVRATATRDPSARALVLTGGFARGEGSAREATPLNDYDFVLVRDRPGGGPVASSIAKALERDLGIKVDLVPVFTGRLPWLAPKLFWVETRAAGRVIAGQSRVIDLIPPFPPSTIPLSEARRLLLNRAVGLLEGSAFGPEAARWHAAKAVLACVEARLIARGLHDPSVATRLARFEALGMIDEIPLARWATAFKLDPAAHDAVDADATWRAAKDALLATHALLFPSAARATFAEVAFHAARSRRIALDPSGAVRRVALAALESCEGPEGPDRAKLARLNLSLAGLGATTAPTDWPGWVSAFLEVRAGTLQ